MLSTSGKEYNASWIFTILISTLFVLLSRCTFGILYFQNTFIGCFKRIIFFALEQKQREILLKSTNKIDVLVYTENFPWLMDFNSLNVGIISDN